jgi:catechol 2,3-dioxygenase-like lactoylglutathione lyase family enzyme
MQTDVRETRGVTDQRACGFTQIATVFVPVADQERALRFYVGALGFEKRVDFIYGGGVRWVEVAPPGSAFALALVPPGEGIAAPSNVTRCAFAAGDIDATYAALRAAGAVVDAVVGRSGTSRSGLLSTTVTIADPQPAQFCFCDPDGNRFLAVESPKN